MVSQYLKQASQWSALALLLILTGCASAPERHPLPPEYTLKAGIPGIPDARFWGDEWPTFAAERFDEFTVADFQREFDAVYDKPHNYLAISGGGSNGAFGAGLLIGWTATGNRPEFSMVTGVSTGALTAPFAFLGPDYDDQMKEVYTTTTTKDIATKRNPMDAAFGDSMTDTAPLRKLIAKYIDAEMIAAIAREHKRGRRLFVGTGISGPLQPVTTLTRLN
jgi:hypothetical protein